MEGYGLQKNEDIAIPIVFENFGLPKKKGITPPIIINNYCILNKARPQQKYVQYDKGWNSFEICYL
jgi:hypothetical protein